MTCTHCADLCQDVRIRSPRDLEQAVRVIGANLEDGTLVEARGPPDTTVTGPTPFTELAGAPPWPDAFYCDFRCARRGESFRLACETYHGSGGRWSFGGDTPEN